MRKKIIFELSAFQDFQHWAKSDREVYHQIIALIKHLKKYPSTIYPQPKPLKQELNGYWSIDLDGKHRLVYKVTKRVIIILSCKYYS